MNRRMARIRMQWLPLPLLCCTTAYAGQLAGAFEIGDYFRLKRVTELALSLDASWLAYRVETYTPDGNAHVSSVRLRSLRGDSTEVAPEVLADAVELAWIPNTHQLAFLAERDGTSQLYSYNTVSGSIQQLTRTADPVESFRFAPDGTTLAYTTRAESPATESLYDQFRQGTHGILIDPSTTSSHDFLNPHWHGMVKREPPALWMTSKGRAPGRVPVPGDPGGDRDAYFWSSDSRQLSVAYVARDLPAAQLRDERTSLGIFDLNGGGFRSVAKASPPHGDRPGTYFKGGEWIPDKNAMLVRRVTETDPWVSDSFVELTLARARQLPAQNSAWRPLEVYPAGSHFIPVSASEILLENTLAGVHSLFELQPAQVARSHMVDGLEGSQSLFQFSSGFSTVAFVGESLTRPQEIYIFSRSGAVSSRKGAARQLTRLNEDVASRVRYRAREVSWKSTDGVTLHGWMLEPLAAKPPKGWPLVTHVHGGPAFPFPNAFAPYFTYWPYPFEVYATNGIAVFMPNYRGTHTYGRKIATGKGEEPANDIIIGVQFLVDTAVADAARLGISGHSHGAFLGPLVMARARFFRAGSFAEGVANSVVMYELMSGQANREIHDAIVGQSLYEAPQRYIEESADLKFAGLTTACLFEAGSDTAALLMLGFPKAALRAGMPTQFIVYPQTGHNIAIPSLQREAAQRNFEWVTSWLLNGSAP
jgi:dipeptidyl aminopeptidase/acylaminoacyl peptidase